MKRIVASLLGLFLLFSSGLEKSACAASIEKSPRPAAAAPEDPARPAPHAVPPATGQAIDPNGTYFWPLYERTAQSHTVLYPFYVREGDFTMAFPFYYRANHGRDHHVLWPLLKLSDGRLTRLLPVWFRADDGSFTLFPLWHQSDQATFWLLPPLYTRHDGSFFAVYPLYAQGEDFWFAFPSVYRRKNESVDALSVWPLYSSEVSSGSAALRVLAYKQWHEPGKSGRSFFPLYAQKQSDELDQSSFYLFPYYASDHKDGGNRMLLPLLGYSWDDRRNRSSFWSPLYYQRDSPTRALKGVPILFSWDKTMSGKEGNDGRQTELQVLQLLYRRSERYDGEQRLTYRKRRFLIFSDQLEQDGSRSFSIFGLPIVERMG